MRSISAKSLAAGAVLLLAAALSIFLLLHHSQSPLDAKVESKVQSTQGYREQWEKKGVLTASDHARLIKISTYIQQRQEMSDDDLDFWIALLKKGPPIDTPSNHSLFYSVMMGDAMGRKHLSQAAQKKMYDAVLPFVSDAAYANAIDPSDTRIDPSDPSTQENLRIGSENLAVILLAQTRDPRALPVLQDLAQNSRSAKIRATAQEYYAKLAAVVR